MQNGGPAEPYESHEPSLDYGEPSRLSRTAMKRLDDYGRVQLPFDVSIDLETKEPDESALRGATPPPTQSFAAVSHVTPKAVQVVRDLDSFVMRELNVTSIETNKIRKELFTIMDKGREVPSLEEKAAILRGIILAANKLGKMLEKEMAR